MLYAPLVADCGSNTFPFRTIHHLAAPKYIYFAVNPLAVLYIFPNAVFLFLDKNKHIIIIQFYILSDKDLVLSYNNYLHRGLSIRRPRKGILLNISKLYQYIKHINI